MKNIFKNPLILIAIPVLAILLGVGAFGVYQYQKISGELAKAKNIPAGQLTDERQRELISEVSAKILLPADEKPTVAVVSDINRLKDQQFFASGQNGDVVLIYMNMKRAILYRPAEKKIVEVAPVNLNQNQQASVAGTQSLEISPTPAQQAQAGPTPTPQPAKFALRNGTSITGLARSFETQLTTKYPTVSVVERGNAVKRTYETTLLIDVAGTRDLEASQIAASLGISKGVLPPEETAPSNADFLIIIGADKK